MELGVPEEILEKWRGVVADPRADSVGAYAGQAAYFIGQIACFRDPMVALKTVGEVELEFEGRELAFCCPLRSYTINFCMPQNPGITHCLVGFARSSKLPEQSS